MNDHSYSIEVAQKVGIPAAVLLRGIAVWSEYNQVNGKNLHDGQTWVFNSVEAWSQQYPELTAKQVRVALARLEGDGWITTGNYNKQPYDRTKWYALTDKAKTVEKSHLPKRANGIAPQGKWNCPKEQTNTKYNTHINTQMGDEEPAARLSDDFKRILETAKSAGIPVNEANTTAINSLCTEFTASWVMHALLTAINSESRGRPSINFIRAILDRYRRQGGPDGQEKPKARDDPNDGYAFPLPDDFDWSKAEFE